MKYTDRAKNATETDRSLPEGQRQTPVTFFRNHTETYSDKTPTSPRCKPVTLDELFEVVDEAVEMRRELKQAGFRFDNPKDGPSVCPAEFDGKGRGKDNIVNVHALVVDVDEGGAVEKVDEFLTSLGPIPIVWWTSFHHGVEMCHEKCCGGEWKGGCARLTLWIPLKEPVGADEYQRLHDNVTAELGLEGDDDATKPTQLHYLPRRRNEYATVAHDWGVLNDEAPFLDPTEYLGKEGEAVSRRSRLKVVKTDRKPTQKSVPDYVPIDGRSKPVVELNFPGKKEGPDGNSWPTPNWLKWGLGIIHPDYCYHDWVKVLAALHWTGHNAPDDILTVEEAKEIARQWCMYELCTDDYRPDPEVHGNGKWDPEVFEATWDRFDPEKDREKAATFDTIGWLVDRGRLPASNDTTFDQVVEKRCAIKDPQFQFTTRSDANLSDAAAYELFADKGWLIFDKDRYWTFDPETGIWRELTESRLNSLLTRWDGEFPLQATFNSEKNPKPLKIGRNRCRGVYELLKSRSVGGGEIVDREVFDDAPNPDYSPRRTFLEREKRVNC